MSYPLPMSSYCPLWLWDHLPPRSGLCPVPRLAPSAHKPLFASAQKERFAALAKFKSSIYRILIATDVASR